MFTGIVEEIGKVVSAQPGTLTIEASKVLPSLQQGSSILVNGACLTVTKLDARSFSVDITTETIKRTNLGLLSAGDKVNLERAVAMGGELGGHLVQGHVDATGKVASIRWEGEAMLMRFEAPPEIMRYVVEKGFIAVDGVSLTVVSNDSRSFAVTIIDYTRRHTILGSRKVGDTVNLEADIIAKYVEKLGHAQSKGVTIDLLREHGFLAS